MALVPSVAPVRIDTFVHATGYKKYSIACDDLATVPAPDANPAWHSILEAFKSCLHKWRMSLGGWLLSESALAALSAKMFHHVCHLVKVGHPPSLLLVCVSNQVNFNWDWFEVRAVIGWRYWWNYRRCHRRNPATSCRPVLSSPLYLRSPQPVLHPRLAPSLPQCRMKRARRLPG